MRNHDNSQHNHRGIIRVRKRKMKEYQIVVYRSYDRSLWYIPQFRKVHFLWRGCWKNIGPVYQKDIESAEELIRKHYIQNL